MFAWLMSIREYFQIDLIWLRWAFPHERAGVGLGACVLRCSAS